MSEHVHGCLTCRSDMVPDFDKADPRYHDGEKCGYTPYALIDGVDPGYTAGIFEGPAGWALVAGATTDGIDTHICASGQHNACLTPVFGHVEVRHRCPERLAAQVQRLKDAIKPFVSFEEYVRIVNGERTA